MTHEKLIKNIKLKAAQDKRKRRDPRFLKVMGFLVAKGFLYTNQSIHKLPNQRINIDDAIWAGINVEPRILEVLPAAVLRLGKHFDFDQKTRKELARVIECLHQRKEEGPAFMGMPYRKVKQWADFPLRDRRVKSVINKKIVKTFRLDPKAFEKLVKVARERGSNMTEVLESLINQVKV